MNLLCKGVKFSPATRNYNKFKFVTDITNWFRNLRLREYFYTEAMKSNTINQNSDRCPLNWHVKSDGNPSNNNEDLEEYIKQVYKDTKTMVNDTKDMKWNNLNKSEREALQNLRCDDSIVIKIADKGGAIVVMNKTDYVKNVTEDLDSKNYYRKLPNDNTGDIIEEK